MTEQPNHSSTEGATDSGSKSGLWLRIGVITMVVIVVAIVFILFRDRLTLDSLAEQESALRQFQSDYPVLVYVIAFALYVAITALSLPGAAALSLVYGWYFGFASAFFVVSFASTLGATCAFLLSRYLFRDGLQRKFGGQLKKFNEALDREGAFYLFTLRLIPAVPFFIINVVMGLTRIRVWTFWWVSQVGMLAGTVVYVYAGSTIPSLSHLADPSQLRQSDILDWPELTAKLNNDESAGNSATRIRALLSDSSRQAITQSANREPSPEQKDAILIGLNEVLKRPDLAVHEDWKSAFETASDDPAKQRAASKQITKLNREILVAAHPDIISPPQPIISRQLIIAFVVLGVFPLAVKKVMQRFKPNTEEAKQESDDP